MITDAIISLFINLIQFLIDILPTGGSFPTGVTEGVEGVSHIIHMFDAIIPMQSIIDGLIFLVTVNIAIFVFFSTKMVFNFIRGN